MTRNQRSIDAEIARLSAAKMRAARREGIAAVALIVT